jgi:hypothetical protein
MARVQKRVTTTGAATYVVKWREPNGQDRSKGGFKTRKAADDYAAVHVEPRRRRGVVVNPHAGKVLFRDVATSRRRGSPRATTSRTRPAPPTRTPWPRRPITR